MGDPPGLVLIERDGANVDTLNIFDAADAEVGGGSEGERRGVGRGGEGNEGVDVLTSAIVISKSAARLNRLKATLRLTLEYTRRSFALEMTVGLSLETKTLMAPFCLKVLITRGLVPRVTVFSDPCATLPSLASTSKLDSEPSPRPAKRVEKPSGKVTRRTERMR